MENKSSGKKPDNLTPIQSVKKYYFLDYIYILLDSINTQSKWQDILLSFLRLKRRYRLGESKYKKLTVDTEDVTDGRIRRYIYTFEQVLDEASEYGLITSDDDDETVSITELGSKLLKQHKRKGSIAFNESLLKLMENKYGAFRYILTNLYKPNRNLSGFLFLPSYSPRRLGFDRELMKTTGNFVLYSEKLAETLEEDIRNSIGIKRNLTKENNSAFDDHSRTTTGRYATRRIAAAFQHTHGEARYSDNCSNFPPSSPETSSLK